MKYLIRFIGIIFCLTTTLILDKDFLYTFENVAVNNKENLEKRWRSDIIYYPSQNFFNSIWLNDKEYYQLVNKGIVKTKYRNENCIIKIRKDE